MFVRVCVCVRVCVGDKNLSLLIKTYLYIRVISYVRNSEMHPGKEAGSLHPEGGDENVGDEDEEDDDGGRVVQAVQALLVALLIEVSSS